MLHSFKHKLYEDLITYSKPLSPLNIKCRHLERNQHYVQCFVKLCIYHSLGIIKSSLAALVLAVNYNRGLTRGNVMCKMSQTDMHHSQNHIKHVRPWVKVQDVPLGRRTINTFFVHSLKRRG